MLKILKATGILAIILLVSACQTEVRRPTTLPEDVIPVEGSWRDLNGIVSDFRSGVFETRTTDTGSLLATGNYSYINTRLVRIRVKSIVRQTTSVVNCAIIKPEQMNCTSNTGIQFTLVRNTITTL